MFADGLRSGNGFDHFIEALCECGQVAIVFGLLRIESKQQRPILRTTDSSFLMAEGDQPSDSE